MRINKAYRMMFLERKFAWCWSSQRMLMVTRHNGREREKGRKKMKKVVGMRKRSHRIEGK